MSAARNVTRWDERRIDKSIWPPHRETTGTVVRLDLQMGGRYVTAECQLGAHHACPGGLRTECQVPMPDMRCRCVAEGCACKPQQESAR
ncbi:hypothetical protein [Kitasatospora sp. NPDC059571]|uniref:hypothetical protein n=1 Tax=Kitasatospora sp. NPDC059571 TaxID=3346871 RepID=UPI0036BAC93B